MMPYGTLQHTSFPANNHSLFYCFHMYIATMGGIHVLRSLKLAVGTVIRTVFMTQ